MKEGNDKNAKTGEQKEEVREEDAKRPKVCCSGGCVCRCKHCACVISAKRASSPLARGLNY